MKVQTQAINYTHCYNAECNEGTVCNEFINSGITIQGVSQKHCLKCGKLKQTAL